jgi:alpha-L-fucosidase
MAAIMKFEGNWKSLMQFRCPDWFRDAKFGIWAHWGPQAVPMIGDWYARNMYIEGSRDNLHHRRTYGHPSVFGYKDIIALWKAERFDPEALIDLYQGAGARYFTACAVHHDNYDCWDSAHHPWNAGKVGPGKDIVGLWEKAARAVGLRFGVTEHHARSYSWFNTNKGADKTGPYAGVPYDGNDPRYVDLYHPPHDDSSYGYPLNPSDAFVRNWYDRISDLIEKYSPDLLYSDGAVPFGETGLRMVARLYNRSLERHEGRLESVYALKDPSHFKNRHHLGEYREGIGVLDVERGVVDGIHPDPWQTDTCIGTWYYNADCTYKTPREVITTLLDVVSKNGNLMLSVPLRPEGVHDDEELWFLDQLRRWFSVNGEGVYGTRPFSCYGEGPVQFAAGAMVSPEHIPMPGAHDFRFTRKGSILYAFSFGWPEKEWRLTSLAGLDVASVELLGARQPLVWRREGDDLVISVPKEKPCDFAWGFRISLSS